MLDFGAVVEYSSPGNEVFHFIRISMGTLTKVSDVVNMGDVLKLNT
jgi:polyribonucleotide nucleotidyltransferase